MSVAITFRAPDGSIILGTDSQATSGQERSLCVGKSKITLVNDGEFGIALGPCEGPLTAFHKFIADCIADDPDNWDNIFIDMMLKPPDDSVISAFKCLEQRDEEGTSIIVGRGRVIVADTNGHLFEPGDDIMAVGSGSSYAMGAAYALRNIVAHYHAQDIVEHSVRAACVYDIYCGPPVYIEIFK